MKRRFLMRDAKRFGFAIYEQGVRKWQGRWHVPVRPTAPNVSALDYARLFHSIEDSFEKKGIKVLLIPAEIAYGLD